MSFVSKLSFLKKRSVGFALCFFMITVVFAGELTDAVMDGDFRNVRRLVRHVETNGVDDAFSAIALAAKLGDSRMFGVLLRGSGAVSPNKADKDGHFPLYYVCNACNDTNSFIGSAVSGKDRDGSRLNDFKRKDICRKMFSILHGSGADMNKVSTDGQDALSVLDNLETKAWFKKRFLDKKEKIGVTKDEL